MGCMVTLEQALSLLPVTNPPQQRIKKKKRKYKKVRFYEVKRLRRARLRSQKRKERELREFREQQSLIMLPGMVPIKEEPQERQVSIGSFQSGSSASSNERLMTLARAAQLEMMSRAPVKIEKGINKGKPKRTRKLAPNTLPRIPPTLPGFYPSQLARQGPQPGYPTRSLDIT